MIEGGRESRGPFGYLEPYSKTNLSQMLNDYSHILILFLELFNISQD
jgi:hypothetical protein